MNTTTVTLTHSTRTDTLDAALVKLGAAHVIVRIGNADVRFARKTGLRIGGGHTRGVGYDDWMIGSDALAALTGEPAAPSRQLPTAAPVEETPAVEPAAPAAPAKRSHKKKVAPASATLPAVSAETPHGVRALGLGFTLAETRAADAAVPADATWDVYVAACEAARAAAVEVEPPVTSANAPSMEDEAAAELDRQALENITPEEQAEIDAIVEEHRAAEDAHYGATPTEAPTAPADEPAPEHRDAVTPSAEETTAPVPTGEQLLSLFDAATATAMCSGSKAMGRFRAALVAYLAAPAQVPPRRASKGSGGAPKASTPRAPRTLPGGLPGGLQRAIYAGHARGLARAAFKAGRAEVTADEARARLTPHPEFRELMEAAVTYAVAVGSKFAAHLLGGGAFPWYKPAQAKSESAPKAKKEAAAPKAKKAKPAPIAVNSRVDIKEAVRAEYMDVVGESQMVGLLVLSITGKSARLMTNAKQTLPKVALSDLVLAG